MLATSLILVLLFTGCARFSPTSRSSEDLILPDSYTLYDANQTSPARWWTEFNSNELNELVDESISGNFSIQQAMARMDQAMAIARQNRSTLFPTIDYGVDAELRSTHRDEGFSASSRMQTLNTESYGLGIASSYEVDLWKRLHANRQSANLNLEATKEDLYAVMHSIAGQVSLTWLDLLEVHQLIAVTQAQLKANQTTLDLMELRFRKGRASALDVFQQRQVIARTESILPPLFAQKKVLVHELNLLSGKAPDHKRVFNALTYPTLDALPAYGVPMDLLANRPDIRASGLRLQSADWQVSAARTDRLPFLRITSGFSFNGDDVDVLFDNWIATLSSSVTGPIFDAGRRKAEVQRTRAVVDERLNAYRQTVLIALTDVENSLTRTVHQEEYIESLTKQFNAAKQTYTEAQNRYQKGLNDYLPVLTALTNSQNLERDVIAAEHDLLALRVGLHLALGGTWMESSLTAESKEH